MTTGRVIGVEMFIVLLTVMATVVPSKPTTMTETQKTATTSSSLSWSFTNSHSLSQTIVHHTRSSSVTATLLPSITASLSRGTVSLSFSGTHPLTVSPTRRPTRSSTETHTLTHILTATFTPTPSKTVPTLTRSGQTLTITPAPTATRTGGTETRSSLTLTAMPTRTRTGTGSFSSSKSRTAATNTLTKPTVTITPMPTRTDSQRTPTSTRTSSYSLSETISTTLSTSTTATITPPPTFSVTATMKTRSFSATSQETGTESLTLTQTGLGTETVEETVSATLLPPRRPRITPAPTPRPPPPTLAPTLAPTAVPPTPAPTEPFKRTPSPTQSLHTATLTFNETHTENITSASLTMLPTATGPEDTATHTLTITRSPPNDFFQSKNTKLLAPGPKLLQAEPNSWSTDVVCGKGFFSEATGGAEPSFILHINPAMDAIAPAFLRLVGWEQLLLLRSEHSNNATTSPPPPITTTVVEPTTTSPPPLPTNSTPVPTSVNNQTTMSTTKPPTKPPTTTKAPPATTTKKPTTAASHRQTVLFRELEQQQQQRRGEKKQRSTVSNDDYDEDHHHQQLQQNSPSRQLLQSSTNTTATPYAFDEYGCLQYQVLTHPTDGWAMTQLNLVITAITPHSVTATVRPFPAPNYNPQFWDVLELRVLPQCLVSHTIGTPIQFPITPEKFAAPVPVDVEQVFSSIALVVSLPMAALFPPVAVSVARVSATLQLAACRSKRDSEVPWYLHPLQFALGSDADAMAKAIGAIVGNGILVVVFLLLHVGVAEIALGWSSDDRNKKRRVPVERLPEEERSPSSPTTSRSSPRSTNLNSNFKFPNSSSDHQSPPSDPSLGNSAMRRREFYRKFKVPFAGVAIYLIFVTDTLSLSFRLLRHGETFPQIVFGGVGCAVWTLPMMVYSWRFFCNFAAIWKSTEELEEIRDAIRGRKGAGGIGRGTSLGGAATVEGLSSSPSPSSSPTNQPQKNASSPPPPPSTTELSSAATTMKKNSNWIETVHLYCVVGYGKWHVDTASSDAMDFFHRYRDTFAHIVRGPERMVYWIGFELVCVVGVACLTGWRPFRYGCEDARLGLAACVVFRWLLLILIRPYKTQWQNGSFIVLGLAEGFAAALLVWLRMPVVVGSICILVLIMLIVKMVFDLVVVIGFRVHRYEEGRPFIDLVMAVSKTVIGKKRPPTTLRPTSSSQKGQQSRPTTAAAASLSSPALALSAAAAGVEEGHSPRLSIPPPMIMEEGRQWLDPSPSAPLSVAVNNHQKDPEEGENERFFFLPTLVQRNGYDGDENTNQRNGTSRMLFRKLWDDDVDDDEEELQERRANVYDYHSKRLFNASRVDVTEDARLDTVHGTLAVLRPPPVPLLPPRLSSLTTISSSTKAAPFTFYTSPLTAATADAADTHPAPMAEFESDDFGNVHLLGPPPAPHNSRTSAGIASAVNGAGGRQGSPLLTALESRQLFQNWQDPIADEQHGTSSDDDSSSGASISDAET